MTKDNESPYYFDEAEASKVVTFFESYLTHSKGELAGKPFKLEQWQKDFLGKLFGWKKKKDGLRKYRKCYMEIGRKNGKTLIAAGIALYMLICDNEPGAEVYSAAGDEEQARLCFQAAKSMVVGNKTLSSKLKIYQNSMTFGTNAFYKALTSKAETKHGGNASCVIYDELHVAPNRNLYDVLSTSMGARRQPLFVIITTAGHDKTSICYEMHEYAEKVRDGVVKDETFLPMLFSAGPEDSVGDHAVWKKANPNLGVSIKQDFIEDEYNAALASSARMIAFRQLYLCQWTEAQEAWLNVSKWRENIVEEPDLTGAKLYLGLDLATKRDITALVELYILKDGRYWIRPNFYCPETQIKNAGKSQKMDYQNWVQQGAITLTPGEITDYDFIENQIREIRKKHTVEALVADPYNASHLLTRLYQEGINVIEQPATQTSKLHDTHKDFEVRILSGDIIQDGNPVMDWMISNVQVQINKDDNIVLKKGMSAEKIDGVVAACLALSRARLDLDTTLDDQIINSKYII